MILLEKLLAGLDARIGAFQVCCLDDGCALPLAPSLATTVHYALKGSGTLRLQNGTAVEILADTFIVVPPSYGVCVETRGDSKTYLNPATACSPISAEPVYPNERHLAAGLVIACGGIHATYGQIRGLFDYVDVPLIERLDENEPIRQAFKQLLVELAAPKVGSVKLAESLLNQCLVHLLRRYCESGECRLPWLAALEDIRLSRALEHMLDRPGDHYTLSGLADLSGMSRSAFAAAFADAFGRPPFDLLKEIRLRRAAELLVHSSMPVKAIAGQVGFESRSAFSRAFKAFCGEGPEAYRTRLQPEWSYTRASGA
ncbi:MAG: helix-turn-helix transcriptional regulator [Alphaproteobacteria bacterium]|nr:helix-turn-helix transcriptional regulator [Alphaproteobacteria bacterium]